MKKQKTKRDERKPCVLSPVPPDKLPPLRCGIYVDGCLKQITEMADPRLHFCHAFNSQNAGEMAMPLVGREVIV